MLYYSKEGGRAGMRPAPSRVEFAAKFDVTLNRVRREGNFATPNPLGSREVTQRDSEDFRHYMAKYSVNKLI